MSTADPSAFVSTGVEALDVVLGQGLRRGRTYLIQGDPGTGKTTLGLQFALDGARRGEACLYVTLAQTESELREIARSHGWTLDDVAVAELSRRTVAEHLAAQQGIFRTADVELGELTEALRERVAAVRPDRVVFDSIGAVRVLAGGRESRYHDEVNLLVQYLQRQGVTALFLDDIPSERTDIEFQTLAHGVIKLTYDSAAYGEDRRRLRVVKMRGIKHSSGYHHFRIDTGGLIVYPRLGKPAKSHADWAAVPTGVAALDEQLGGGLDFGTSCVIVGAAGTGKTTLATLYVTSALERGEQAAVILFDERRETFLARAESLNMRVGGHLEAGRLHVQDVDTAEISPGELAGLLREAVERGARVVVIDSLTGYFHAMAQSEMLLAQMHEMLTYLSRSGVLALLIVAQHGLVSPFSDTPADVSYVADTVVLMRYFEAAGEVRKAISVVKKRHGNHEKSVRELRLTGHGIEVGEPITEFRGVLSGHLTYTGDEGRLLPEAERDDAPAPGPAGRRRTGRRPS